MVDVPNSAHVAKGKGGLCRRHSPEADVAIPKFFCTHPSHTNPWKRLSKPFPGALPTTPPPDTLRTGARVKNAFPKRIPFGVHPLKLERYRED